MAQKLLLLVGTKKGAFIIESDADRRTWRLRGPFCEAWPINHVAADPATGYYAFEYDPAWRRTGIELAPLTMPHCSAGTA